MSATSQPLGPAIIFEPAFALAYVLEELVNEQIITKEKSIALAKDNAIGKGISNLQSKAEIRTFLLHYLESAL